MALTDAERNDRKAPAHELAEPEHRVRELEAERDAWEERCHAHEERAEGLEAALTALRDWCKRPEWSTNAVIAHVHGFREPDGLRAEGERVWALVDRALAREPAGGETSG